MPNWRFPFQLIQLGSSKNALNQSNSGLAALQNMMMGTAGSSSNMRGSGSSSAAASSGHGLQGASAKEILAQSQAFFKEQQKLLQQLPPMQRKTYEAFLSELKQQADQK